MQGKSLDTWHLCLFFWVPEFLSNVFNCLLSPSIAFYRFQSPSTLFFVLARYFIVNCQFSIINWVSPFHGFPVSFHYIEALFGRRLRLRRFTASPPQSHGRWVVIGFVLRCKNIKIRVTWNTLADFFPALSGVEGKIGLIFLAFLSTWHLLFIIDYLLFVRNLKCCSFYA